MLKTLKRLEREKQLDTSSCPWLLDNTIYLTKMGSEAYGTALDSSDLDVYGIVLPPIRYVFPHTQGLIHIFDTPETFNQYQSHHVKDKDALAGKGREIDLTIYNIVTYFKLLLENNPNILDSIYTPIDCVLHNTQTSQLIRDNRTLFLHKGLWSKFRGYAMSQLHKMSSKERTGSRKEVVEEYGYDLKFASHIVRLMEEAEQLLLYGDMDLQLHNEILKSIRRGEWTEEQIREYVDRKSKILEELYINSPLPNKPRRSEVRQLLYNCLEHHYGSLSEVMTPAGADRDALLEIRQILNRVGV